MPKDDQKHSDDQKRAEIEEIIAKTKAIKAKYDALAEVAPGFNELIGEAEAGSKHQVHHV